MENFELIANLLLDSYQILSIENVEFETKYETPMLKLQSAFNLRGILASKLTNNDQFTLHSEYLQCGRIDFSFASSPDQSYRLRSKRRIDIDNSFDQRLFCLEDEVTSVFQYLVFEFTEIGLNLFTMNATLKNNHLSPTGVMNHVGSWQFEESLGFDQGLADKFNDLDEIAKEEEL